MRSRSSDTLTRFCARHVLCWPAFPLVPVLGSTGSAAFAPALFAGFTATMTESDFSCPVHHRLRLLAFPMRAGNGSAAPVRPETSQLPMRSFCT